MPYVRLMQCLLVLSAACGGAGSPQAEAAQRAPAQRATPEPSASEPSVFEREVTRLQVQGLHRAIRRWHDAAPEQFAQADRELLEAVPQQAWRPAHYFLLATVLECERPELASEFLKVARAAHPLEPQVLLGTAVELQRAGRCAEAVPAYERAIEDVRRSEYAGLLGECYLQLGRLDDAWAIYETYRQQQWAPSSLRPRAERIIGVTYSRDAEYAWPPPPRLYDCKRVHGEPSFLRQRARLREQIAGGDSARAVELIELDLGRTPEHGLPDGRESILAEDVAWLAQQPGITRGRLHELEAYASMYWRFPGRAEVWVRRKLNPSCARGARLPEDPRLTLAMIRRFVRVRPWVDPPSGGCDSAAELMAVHEAALRGRSQAGDAYAALSLVALYTAIADDPFRGKGVSTGGDRSIPARWREYWDRHQLPEFACGHLEELAQRGLLAGEHPDLVRALREFPGSACVKRLFVQSRLAGRSQRPWGALRARAE